MRPHGVKEVQTREDYCQNIDKMKKIVSRYPSYGRSKKNEVWSR
jgi:hypothetical protein